MCYKLQEEPEIRARGLYKNNVEDAHPVIVYTAGIYFYCEASRRSTFGEIINCVFELINPVFYKLPQSKITLILDFFCREYFNEFLCSPHILLLPDFNFCYPDDPICPRVYVNYFSDFPFVPRCLKVQNLYDISHV